MKNDGMKWAYTFFLLLLTVGWAAFCVIIVSRALAQPTAHNTLEVAGVSALLGALIAWCGNVNQYWFRKKPTKEDDK